jgi:hypothetical protein
MKKFQRPNLSGQLRDERVAGFDRRLPIFYRGGLPITGATTANHLSLSFIRTEQLDCVRGHILGKSCLLTMLNSASFELAIKVILRIAARKVAMDGNGN